MGRTEKALYNILFSIASNVLILILKFFNRTILLWTLGEEYLGISGLFSSIFSILDLAELGIGTAITFSMYKPLAEKDKEKVKSLMQLYKKSYIMIGIVILGIGILLFPILPYIIKDKAELVNVNAIYLLYLVQAVSSYCFFSYKSAIIGADQKEYKITRLNMICQMINAVLQCLVLLVFHSFVLFVAINIAVTICKNYISARMAEKLYPYIKEADIQELEIEEKTKINRN